MADQLKDIDWDNVDRTNMDAQQWADLVGKIGDTTVGLNDQFGTEDWNMDWQAINGTIDQSAQMADQLKGIDWSQVNKDNMNASELAALMNGLGDLTVGMNDQFGSEDWNDQWGTVKNSINETSAIADQLKAMDWDNLDKTNLDASTMAQLINKMGGVTNNMNN